MTSRKKSIFKLGDRVHVFEELVGWTPDTYEVVKIDPQTIWTEHRCVYWWASHDYRKVSRNPGTKVKVGDRVQVLGPFGRWSKEDHKVVKVEPHKVWTEEITVREWDKSRVRKESSNKGAAIGF